jgi:competence protein ComEC
MFAGDIPSGVEDALVEQYQNLLDIDFYKADHHGSKYSSSETWLLALTPDITTISCSSTNGKRVRTIPGKYVEIP